MSPRKRVEAWATVNALGDFKQIATIKGVVEVWCAEPDERVVHLTEADPRASAELRALRRVVRAAVKHCVHCPDGHTALEREVESYLSKRKGRK